MVCDLSSSSITSLGLKVWFSHRTKSMCLAFILLNAVCQFLSFLGGSIMSASLAFGNISSSNSQAISFKAL